MTSVGELVKRLRGVQMLIGEGIDRARAARTDVERAHAMLGHTFAGASRPDAQAPGHQWDGARGHLDNMIGRMLSAIHVIDVYVERIAPGSGRFSVSQNIPGEPQGDKTRQGRLGSFFRQTTERADEVIDGARSVTSLVERGVIGARGGTEPTGAPQTGLPPSFVPRSATPSVPDLVAGVVAGAILAVEGARAGWRYVQRGRKRRGSGTDK